MKSETAEDMSDFVEYAYGGPRTAWGSVRAADGHPEPYKPFWVRTHTQTHTHTRTHTNTNTQTWTILQQDGRNHLGL